MDIIYAWLLAYIPDTSLKDPDRPGPRRQRVRPQLLPPHHEQAKARRTEQPGTGRVGEERRRRRGQRADDKT